MAKGHVLVAALLLAWSPCRARARDKEFMLTIPAGVDVGTSRLAGDKSAKLGIELSVVDLHWPSLGWFGAFVAAGSVAGAAEVAFGPELGIAALGADIGPIWRAHEPGGWGWRTRVHLTWLFSSLYVGVGELAQGGQFLDLGFHCKPAWPLFWDVRRNGLGPALTAYEARGWTVH